MKNTSKKLQPTPVDKTTFLLFFILTFLALWSLYYNGRNLSMSCDIINKRTLCSYEVSILNYRIYSRKNEILYEWEKGKYSLHLYFQNDSISLGFIDDYPPAMVENTYRIKYQPFSKIILWIVCFIPSLAAIIFSIGYLVKSILASLGR